MLHFFSGTDREKARAQMKKAVDVAAKKNAFVVRITDANTLEDFEMSLRGGGMFDERRVIVFDGVLGNSEMSDVFMSALPHIKSSEEEFFVYEEKPDAATRKQVEKYAQTSERFDAAKKIDGGTTIFALANAVRRGDKKELWVAYMRESLTSAPEAIHGVLFWGAKDMFLKARGESERARAQKLIFCLAELPHESRRKGYELGYALEQFVLSGL